MVWHPSSRKNDHDDDDDDRGYDLHCFFQEERDPMSAWSGLTRQRRKSQFLSLQSLFVKKGFQQCLVLAASNYSISLLYFINFCFPSATGVYIMHMQRLFISHSKRTVDVFYAYLDLAIWVQQNSSNKTLV